MSRIYFHSPSGTVDISGRARLRGDIYSRDFTSGILDLDKAHWQEEASPARWFLKHVQRRERGSLSGQSSISPYLRQGDADERSIALAAQTVLSGSFLGEVEFVDAEGRAHSTWSIAMNTGLRAFDDPLRLSIRLHGQCEIHAWVDGPNRSWLAGIMEDGLKSGVFRAEDRWSDAIKLLRSRSDMPVVTSFSVTEQFPSHESLDPSTQEEIEAMDSGEAWERAMKWLREKPGGLELKPDGFRDYFFDHGMDAFKVMAAWRDAPDGGAEDLTQQKKA